MLIAAIGLGYVLAAAAFYIVAAKNALEVEETGASLPTRAFLTVVEGGGSADDVLKAA